MSYFKPQLAFLFPGQGSQSVGMLAELGEHASIVRTTFDEASDVLGYDLWSLVQNGPAETLNNTLFTQPAMLAAGVSAWRAWCESSDVRPSWMAGHSLGEYSALVCSESLAFSDALKLVAERARLMQEAVPVGVGAMAAILGLDDEKVLAVCNEASNDTEIVKAANFNSPGQVVIAGDAAAVSRAAELAKSQGARLAVMLPVSVPSHCPLMQPAADKFRHVLSAIEFKIPTIKIVHNVDVTSHMEPDSIRWALEQQLCGSVRWTETIRFMASQGVDQFIESGPGRVLAGLNKRIATEAACEAIFDSGSLANAVSFVQ